MGQLISLLAVVLFSFASFAENGLGPLVKTDFSPLINENILEQELTAEKISQSTQLASAKSATDTNESEVMSDNQDEHALVESVKIVPTGTGAEALAAQQAAKAAAAATSAASPRSPANEKDFQLKLHPTGLASAKRYFPPKPPAPPRIKSAKASRSSKIAKATKQSNRSSSKSSVKVAGKSPKKSEKVAKVEKKIKTKKSKNSGRSTASIKKKSKNKKSSAQTSSSGKI